MEVENASPAFTDVTKKMIVPIRVMRKIAVSDKLNLCLILCIYNKFQPEDLFSLFLQSFLLQPVPKQTMDLNAIMGNASFSDTSAMEKKIAVMEVMNMMAAKWLEAWKSYKLISSNFQIEPKIFKY